MPAVEGWEKTQQPYRMDRRIFSDEAVLERELELVFTPSWQFVAFESELPDRGDYVVRRMGRDSVIVTRDEQGEIAVLLNSCNHRGTRLCRATFGNAAHFTCSYHGWTYANDGRLVGVPHLRAAYPPEFEKSLYDLSTARVASHRGFVFATWSQDGPSLAEYLGDFLWYLDATLSLVGGEWEVYGPPQRVIAKGNWKVPTDNFAGDGYHMGTTHKAAFEQGIYGNSLASGTLGRKELELIGINVTTGNGHSLRAGYVVGKGERDIATDISDPFYAGYLQEMWPGFTAGQTREQIRFNSRCEVLHGAVFPNMAFLSVSHDKAIGRDGDPLTRYTVWRTHTPVDARHTECHYWTLVPKTMPEEWKRRSYAYQARSQSAGGMLFEMDDFENFARIDSAVSGTVSGTAPLDLTLGLGLGESVPGFPGPGNAEFCTLSERNQRAFYRRWGELMGYDGLMGDER